MAPGLSGPGSGGRARRHDCDQAGAGSLPAALSAPSVLSTLGHQSGGRAHTVSWVTEQGTRSRPPGLMTRSSTWSSAQKGARDDDFISAFFVEK